MRYFSIFMKTFNNKYTNKFTEMIYKYNIYNYTKPLLKDNDILKDNILSKSKKKIPFNEQWETKGFYRKND